MKEKTPIFQDVITGTIAATIEAMVNHPLWSWKLRAQSGASFTLNPLQLYRGITLSILSRIPTTAIQITFSRIIQERVLPNTYDESYKSLIASLLGGAFAAIPLSSAELVMTYQQKFGKTFIEQTKCILETRGFSGLFTGYFGTSIRLSTYTASFFSVQPELKQKMISNFNMHIYLAHIIAAVATGILSTIISNPPDVIKTLQQDNLPVKKLSMTSAFKQLNKTRGVSWFFSGVPARAVRVCSGIAIISAIKEKMEDCFDVDDDYSSPKKLDN